jgi:hypothetical protein
MFKFNIEQLVFYIHENKICSAKILARRYIDHIKDFAENPFGEDCILYYTCHGIFDEDQIFASKDELIEHLKG